MPIDVRMPDGTLVKNVPDNITQADLAARFDAFKAQVGTPVDSVTPQAPVTGPEGAPIPPILQTQEKPKIETASPLEALVGSTKRMASDVMTGAQLPFDANKATIEGMARQEGITEKSATSLEAVKQAYEKEGFLPAAKEVATQVPGFFAEQAPLIGSMAAGARTGYFFGGPYGALAGSVLLPLLAYSGSSAERKAAEQIARGEKVDIDASGAFASGAGMAALDRLSFGLSGLSKLFGISAKQFGTQSANKIARESIGTAIAKGTIKTELAELPTEIAQQAIERYYAGLSLTDADALKEYGEIAYATSLMGPLGGAARLQERSQAKKATTPTPPPVSERIEPEVTPREPVVEVGQPTIVPSPEIEAYDKEIAKAKPTETKVFETSHDTQAMMDELSGKSVEYIPEPDEVKAEAPKAIEAPKEEPTGVITEEEKEFTPVGGRLINKADADKLARESAIALEQNLTTQEAERDKQLRRELREDKFPAAETPSLATTLKSLGGINQSNKLDMLKDTGKVTNYESAFSKDGEDLLTHIENGSLDEYLPHQLRLSNTPPNEAFDARPGYDYISSVIESKQKVHDYDYELAKIDHENQIKEKYLAKQYMEPNEAAQAAAAEEQGKIFLSEGEFKGGSTPDVITQSVKNELGKEGNKLLDNEKIIVVKDINDLKEKNYLGDRINQLTDNTRALYDPVTDRSYFIADRMNPAEVRAMAMHEVGTHYGMKKMLGDTAYKTVLNNVKKLSNTDTTVRSSYNETLKSYSNLLETNPEAFYEEVLAHLGETAPNHSLWKQILQKIKTFLIKYGVVKNISASELQDLVMTSLRRAAYEKAKPLKVAPETQIMSSEKEQIKKVAGWTDDRVEKLIRYGTYHGTKSEKYAREYAVMMTPDEFLGLTTNKEMMKTLEKEASELGPLDIDKMKEYDVPMYIKLKGPRTYEVENQWGSEVDTTQDAIKVNGHEGRHRAILLKRAGVEKIPVVLMPEGGGQVNRDIIRILKLFPQFDGGNEAIVRNIIPINRLHEAELKGMLDESTIKYSQRPPLNIKGQEVIPQWESPDESKLDLWIYRLQNKQIDTKRVQQAIGEIEDNWNVYEKEQLYHGRTASGIRNFLLKELLPVIKQIEELKISPEEVRTYLHNRHAEERNIQMNKINPGEYDPKTNTFKPSKLKDKGSGISTTDARAYLAGLDPAKKQLLERVADKFDQMVRGTQQILINSGAESSGTIAQWNKTYKHYVPLFRVEDDMAKPSGLGGTGQGFGTRGAFSKRALGSEKDVQDILSNIIAQRERALIRAEKIRVGRALYGLAIKNPNPDFWLPINPDAIRNKKQAIAELTRMGIPRAEDVINNLMAEPKERYLKKVKQLEGKEPEEDFDFDSGLPVNESKEVVASKVNVMARYKDYVFPIRIDGKDRYVFFNQKDPRAVRMVQSLKNLDVENLGWAIGLAGKATRWFKNVNTQYNPVFGLINFLRDFGGTFLNLTNTEIKGKQAQVIAGAYKAMGGILNVHRAERKGKAPSTGPWATLYQEYRDQGTQTGYRDSLIRNQEEMQIIERTLAQFKDGNTKKAFYAVLGGLTDYNDMMENAFRLSAYKVALDQGLSKQKAAIIAKNLTVNFDRKGAWTAQTNALYAFFNASVQGTERIYQTLKGPKGKVIIGGGILAGMVQALMLAAAGYDDDPPEFVREKNFIVPLADGTYFTIPYPLGYNVLPSTGRIVTEFMLHGGKNPGKHVASLTSAIVNSVNPLGSSGFATQTLMPTVIDPLVALGENKDSFGRPISRQDRATAPTPGYSRSRETSTALGKGIAEFLNWASGGDKYVKGSISPTGDDVDFLAGQIGGGLYREISKAAKAVGSTITGEEIPSYRRPIVGRFIGETGSNAAISQTFYENVTRLTDHENTIKGLRKDKLPTDSYKAKNPEARLWPKANSVENQVNAINKQKREAIEKNKPKEVIQRLDEKKARIMKQFNDQVKQVNAD